MEIFHYYINRYKDTTYEKEEKVRSYRNNKIIFIFYTLFTGKMFIGTTQVLFLSFKGFTFTEIMFISTISGIISLTMEIPSGMLADRIGCKKCVITGLLITILAYLFILFSTHFIHLVLYSILSALGSAALSGADYTLLYESLVCLKEESQFKEYLRKLNSIKMYFVAIVTIFSGILYKINVYLPFSCAVFFLVLALAFSIGFKEVYPSKKEERTIVEYFKYSIKCIKENKIFRLYSTEGALFAILFLNQNIFLQQYMVNVGIEVSQFGVVFFLYNLITAFVSNRSAVLEELFGKKVKMVGILVIAVCFIMAGIINNYFGVVILALCRVSIATINPILYAQVNESIRSGNRATMLSVFNALSSIADAICSPIIGMGIDTVGIAYMYIVMGMIALLIVGYLALNKNNEGVVTM